MAFTHSSSRRSGKVDILFEIIVNPFHPVHNVIVPMITLSLREYFEPDAPERNHIPVVNTNLSSEQVI